MNLKKYLQIIVQQKRLKYLKKQSNSQSKIFPIL